MKKVFNSKCIKSTVTTDTLIKDTIYKCERICDENKDVFGDYIIRIFNGKCNIYFSNEKEFCDYFNYKQEMRLEKLKQLKQYE